MSRHEDLDWVRTVAAVGIVLLHASSIFVSRESQLAVLGVTPAMLCNQIPRFGVPAFFMLSGLGLGLSKRSVKLPGFWLHRLRKIAIPYVLWTAFYFLLNHRAELAGLQPLRILGMFGRLLLNGGAASHLWFLPVLLQLYLIYPGLKWLMRRAPGLTLAVSFLLTLLCTLTVYVPLPLRGWLRPRLWRLFPTWLFFFVLGMAVTGERLEKLRGCLRKHAAVLCAAAAVLALVYTWDSLRCGNMESVKPQLLVYAPVCFLALMASWKLCGRSRALTVASRYIARHSTTVYYAHIFFIQYLRRWPIFNRSFLTMLLTFAAALVLSLLLSLLPELYGVWRGRKPAASN